MTRAKRPLLIKLLLIFALSVLIAFGGYGCGRLIDCSPGQQDGQCGLGTFAGLYVGVAGGIAVLCVGWLIVIWEWHVSRRQPVEGRD
jgi:hypothetical protein